MATLFDLPSEIFDFILEFATTDDFATRISASIVCLLFLRVSRELLQSLNLNNNLKNNNNKEKNERMKVICCSRSSQMRTSETPSMGKRNIEMSMGKDYLLLRSIEWAFRIADVGEGEWMSLGQISLRECSKGGIWNCWRGRKGLAVIGTGIPAHLQLKKDTYTCWSGSERMGVHGTTARVT